MSENLIRIATPEETEKFSHLEVTADEKTNEENVKRFLKEQGFDLGDIPIKHYLLQDYSEDRAGHLKWETGIQYISGMGRGCTAKGSPEHTLKQLREYATLYLGLGTKPPTEINPPYLAIIHPKQDIEKAVGIFYELCYDLGCGVMMVPKV